MKAMNSIINDPKTRIILGYNQFLCAESLAEGGEFSLSVFEDFNRLIEAVVLYDKVVVLGDYELPSGIFASTLNQSGILEKLPDQDLRSLTTNDQTKQLFFSTMGHIFGEDVLEAEDTHPLSLLDLRIPPNLFDSLSYSKMFYEVINCSKKTSYDHTELRRWLTQNVFQTRKQGGHFYYIARAVLYSSIAEFLGMDYAPDVLRLPIAALSFSKGTKPLPKALYDALVEKLNSEIEALTLIGMPVSIFVPPLTAKILSKAISPRNYPSEVLELREKFFEFRKAYYEFLQLLKKPDVTLIEKIEAKERLFDRITGIIEKGEGQHALNLRTIWDKLISSDLGESGLHAKLSLSGMVSFLLEQLSKERIKGHARALFDLWTDTINMKDYCGIIEKTFKTEIDRKEVESFKAYSRAIRSIIRCSSREIG